MENNMNNIKDLEPAVMDAAEKIVKSNKLKKWGVIGAAIAGGAGLVALGINAYNKKRRAKEDNDEELKCPKLSEEDEDFDFDIDEPLELGDDDTE